MINPCATRATLAATAQGRYDEAIRQFRQALRAWSADPRISNNLALALSKAWRYDEALTAFQKHGAPGNAYNNLGVMYWAAADRGKAIACFQRAIEVSPAYEPTARHNLAALQLTPGTQPHPEDEARERASTSCGATDDVQRLETGSP